MPKYEPGTRHGIQRQSTERTLSYQNSLKQNISYHLQFPSRTLKYFEKEIATIEAQTILQGELSLNNHHVVLNTSKLLDTKILERMSAFDRIKIYENSHEEEVITHQYYLENSHPDIKETFKSTTRKSEPRRNRNYLIHDLHPYKGRFFPQLIKPLINAFCKPKDTILDPFCGSGTTLLEANLLGIGGIGIDLNPMAYFITKVKMQCLNMEYDDVFVKCQQLLQKLKRRVMLLRENYGSYLKLVDTNSKAYDLHQLLNSIPNREAWFNRGVLEELLLIRLSIEECQISEIRDFMLLSLSAIVKNVSNWDSSSIRQRLLKVPKSNVLVFDNFQEKLEKNLVLLRSFQLIRSKIGAVKANYSVFNTDSRKLDSVDDCSINAVITSPPYSTSASLPYIDTDKLSMYILGLLSPNLKSNLKTSIIGERDISEYQRLRLEEYFTANYRDIMIPSHIKSIIKRLLVQNRKYKVGFRRRNLASTLYRYFNDMHKCINEMSRVIIPGGTICMVVGDGYTKVGDEERVLIPTTRTISEMTEMAGFKPLKTIAITPTQNMLILKS